MPIALPGVAAYRMSASYESVAACTVRNTSHAITCGLDVVDWSEIDSAKISDVMSRGRLVAHDVCIAAAKQYQWTKQRE